MEIHCWPKLVTKEKLDNRKGMQMKKNDKWMQKWEVNIHNTSISNKK